MNQSKPPVKSAVVPLIYTGGSLTVVLNGKPYSFAKDAPGFDQVRDLAKGGAAPDDILDYINRDLNRLKNATQALGSDVAINVNAGVVTYKGAEVRNTLTEKMLEMLEEGFDLEPMAKFLNNLMANPSMRAINELYGFLEKGNLPITPDGHFLAYKAVRADFKDIHSGTLDNSVGQVVSMPRNAVDDNKDQTCSYGLHFCSVDYLKHFARTDGHVMVLKINPADVVSIPADYNDTKGRCARYEVVDEYHDFDISNPNQDLFKGSVYNASATGITPYGQASSTPAP